MGRQAVQSVERQIVEVDSGYRNPHWAPGGGPKGVDARFFNTKEFELTVNSIFEDFKFVSCKTRWGRRRLQK